MPSDEPFISQGMYLVGRLFHSGKRVFTTEDAKREAGSDIPLDQVNKILANLAKRKLIFRLRRGVYVALGILPKRLDTHSFIISAFLVQPSMISHFSALQYHGLTEQIPQAITASTPRKIVTPSMREKKLHDKNQKHAWEINGVRYEYMTILEKNFFGFEKIWPEEDLCAKITDKERTLLDLFIYPQLFGGFGEALGILESAIASIDIKKLVDYAIRYDKKSVIKRLGWALSCFGVSKKELKPLLEAEIHYYCRLDSSKPAMGDYDKEWMIQNNLKG